VRTFLEHKDYSTAIDVNPHYITPKMLQLRLQKIMDEYVAGVATYYNTNDKMLAVAEGKLEMLKEDAQKMRAKDLHELLRAWENYHRILTAEAHMKHIQFREESRYPGFYYRTDKNFVDEKNWHCFVNSSTTRTVQEVDLLQAQARRSGGQVEAVQGRRALSAISLRVTFGRPEASQGSGRPVSASFLRLPTSPLSRGARFLGHARRTCLIPESPVVPHHGG
jgi:hypothetical protein